MRMNECERGRRRVCVLRSQLSSTQDLSLPDVTVRVAASRITAYCLKLLFLFPLRPSFFAHSPCLPFPLSLSLLFFFLPSPFPAVFGARSSENEGSSPPIVSVLRGARRLDPSLLLSLSPLSPVTPFLSHPLSLSSPCCDRAHLLDLGCTSSESNYPIGPCSHFTVSSPPFVWIFGSQANLNHFYSLCRASAENRLPASSTMRSACLSLLLVTACWALPFRQSGFLDFMMEDDAGSGLPDVTKDFNVAAVPEGPKCPFRCQCHLRVIQCSDLGLKAVPGDIPDDTTLLDLQNNKISEIKENDFKNLKGLHALILVNNKITTIHAKALSPLTKLQRLYLSKNLLKDMPANMPKSLQELRIHENEITKIKKASFQGMSHIIVMELGSNPLKGAGVEANAFADLKRVSYIRIADTNITEIPKGLPSSLSELHLDGNKITKLTSESLKGLKNLAKLGLSYNAISTVENGTLANVPHLRELHMDNNVLTSVPPGLPDHKYIQVVYLHANKIAAVGTEDFCPPGFNTKKAMYSGISLFSNPVSYWEVQPVTFRCVFDRSAIQLGNYRKK